MLLFRFDNTKSNILPIWTNSYNQWIIHCQIRTNKIISKVLPSAVPVSAANGVPAIHLNALIRDVHSLQGVWVWEKSTFTVQEHVRCIKYSRVRGSVQNIFHMGITIILMLLPLN